MDSTVVCRSYLMWLVAVLDFNYLYHRIDTADLFVLLYKKKKYVLNLKMRFFSCLEYLKKNICRVKSKSFESCNI